MLELTTGENLPQGAMDATTIKLFWVYGDKDDTPYVLINPPENLPDLLRAWNSLDAVYTNNPESEEAANWLPVNEWLRERGVTIIEPEEVRLDDYHA